MLIEGPLNPQPEISNQQLKGRSVYTPEAKELLQLLKQGRSYQIILGGNKIDCYGPVIRIFGDSPEQDQDFPTGSLVELASHAPLFSGNDAGPLDQPHQSKALNQEFQILNKNQEKNHVCSNCGNPSCEIKADLEDDDTCTKWAPLCNTRREVNKHPSKAKS